MARSPVGMKGHRTSAPLKCPRWMKVYDEKVKCQRGVAEATIAVYKRLTGCQWNVTSNKDKYWRGEPPLPVDSTDLQKALRKEIMRLARRNPQHKKTVKVLWEAFAATIPFSQEYLDTYERAMGGTMGRVPEATAGVQAAAVEAEVTRQLDARLAPLQEELSEQKERVDRVEKGIETVKSGLERLAEEAEQHYQEQKETNEAQKATNEAQKANITKQAGMTSRIARELVTVAEEQTELKAGLTAATQESASLGAAMIAGFSDMHNKIDDNAANVIQSVSIAISTEAANRKQKEAAFGPRASRGPRVSDFDSPSRYG